MQFSKILFFGIAAVLSATGEACKCYHSTGGSTNNGATHKCCKELGGVYSGNDCKASSISEHLRAFDSCCKGQGSDCDFPNKRTLGRYQRFD